jgi:hypothetical protein
MNWSKLGIATLIGGLVYFLVGWLVYGLLLKDAMPLPEGIMRPDDQMNMGFMIVSCLAFAALLAYIASRIGISTLQSGAILGAAIGALVSLSVGFGQAAMYTFGTAQNALIDTVSNAVVSGIAGGAIGWYFGRNE